MAEALACRRALQLAIQREIPKTIIETDSLEIATLVNKPGDDRSVYRHIIQELRRLLQSLPKAKLVWAQRTSNEAAHRIAQEGVSERCFSTWLLVRPDFIRLILEKDCNRIVV